MKKSYKNITVSLMIAVVLFLGACNEEDFLDRQPEASPSPSNFFVDATTARMAVNACYHPWMFDSYLVYRRDMLIVLNAMTDDSYWRPNRNATIALEMWNYNPTHENVAGWWRYPFQSINAANFAIDNISSSSDPGFTQEQQKAYLAEAKFMRAYSYLFLTYFYGGVPLLTSVASNFEEFNTPRASKADVLAQVVEDFTYAKDFLPAKQSEQGPPNKAAGAAFLAKTYLVMKDWVKAEAAAREAVQMAESAGNKLQDNYLSIWTDEGNPEVLFAWNYAENVDGYGTDMTVQLGCRDIPADLRIAINGDGWGYSLPQKDLYDEFEDGDPRREFTLYSPGHNYEVYPGPGDYSYTHEKYDNTGEKVTWNVTYKPGEMLEYDYRWSPTGLNQRKMARSIKNLVSVYQSGLDIPQMRMGEVYLLLAEALAEQGKPEALTWVNKVRARPSVNVPARALNDGKTGGTSLRDIVRHERRVELALEGLRLYDLIRWGTLAEVFGDGKKVKRHFYADYYPEGSSLKYDSPIGNLNLDPIFPIPQYELDHNSAINTNNPGW
ncbi:MAG: RagB/SusD family nutrient uptake outer membrane protein [Mangrovibacterium sp.]|nr:RagB/SusD family nutrient uptake outer membrane protein [Mangrovibacterium sp.]